MNMRYRNAMQRDPNLAKAFDNLAGLFAPPSGSDFLASAKMQSERADAARRDWLFNNSADPTASARSSLLGIQNYGQTPSGFNKSDATVRFTNAADNTRMLQTNEADNRARVAVKALDPIAENQFRLGFPSVANMYAMPELAQSARGNISAKPGEIITTPENEVFRGAPQALSVDQAKAAALERARAAGQVTDQQIVDLLTPNTIETTDPTTGKRVITTPGRAAREERSPAQNRTVARTLTDSQGRPINVFTDGTAADLAGNPVDPNTAVFAPAQPQGSNEQVGKGTTQNRSRAQAIRGTVANADRLMADIDQTIRANPASAGVAANIVSFGQDVGQVFKEFGERFGNPNTPVSFGDLQALAARVSPGDYNPVYRRVRAQLLELAYTNARLNNPSGEVSRYSLEREIEALGLGSVGNDQAVLAVLDASRGRLRRSLVEADVLEGTASAPTADSLYTPQAGQPAQPGTPQQPAQPAAQPTAPQQPRTRTRYDVNGNPVP